MTRILRSKLTAGLLWVGMALGSASSPATAQPPPDIETLRARLAKVRKAQRGELPDGAFHSIAYTIDVAERIAGRFARQSAAWRKRAAGFLDLAAQGKDPIVAQRGEILMRGYRSPVSTLRQGYAIYIPESYDPSKRYPLLVMLHGGSANGNLFLGVVLGNNMNWKEYSIHLWDDFEPRWSPEWIVVAPDGFGQVMWRWMGERDVLDVIDDVQRHYSVDPDRVVLGGLSNGGVGAYNIGMRHAWRFSAVQAIAGAPSWLQYSGGRMHETERIAMARLSGMQLAENAINTDFHYYHGQHDTGPMRPRYVKEFTERIEKLGVPFEETWFDAGHDLLYLVHKHGRNYPRWAKLRRERHPAEVRVVTGDYRANRQHWVTVTRIEDYPKRARVRAIAKTETHDGTSIDLLDVETRNTLAFSLDLRDAPLTDRGRVRVVVDDAEVYDGALNKLGHVLHLARNKRGWHTGFLHEDPDALEKRPGSAGPITDAYYGSMVHVYGTRDPEHTEALKKSARRGARGWPLWLWRVRQRVVADTEVDAALMREHHLVLYGTPGSNAVLERIAGRLPIRVESDAVVVGDERFDQKGVGTKFIHPNPLAENRYVIVQAAPTVRGVNGGHKLPDFLPDYVVYDAKSTAKRARLVFPPRRRSPAAGYFDRYWRLSSGGEGGDPIPAPEAKPEAKPGTKSDKTGDRKPDDEPAPTATPKKRGPINRGAIPRPAPTPDAGTGVTVPPAPAAPPPPKRFAAPRRTQAGKAARTIARRLQRSFRNFRAKAPGATWVVDPAARWSIRGNKRCLKQLERARIRARPWEPLLPTPVPTPVEVLGRVRGVWFRMTHSERTLLMSCEMAARLPAIVHAVEPHDVVGIDVMSAYREKPHASFHTMGLALDLLRFFTPDSVLSVLYDFVETPNHETCKAPQPSEPRAQKLLDIACRLQRTKAFSTVLTPNYNEGHRDHFHIDSRPDDPRVFLR